MKDKKNLLLQEVCFATAVSLHNEKFKWPEAFCAFGHFYKILQNFQKLLLDFLPIIDYDVVDIKQKSEKPRYLRSFHGKCF